MTWGIPVGRSLPVAAVTSANYAGLPASFLPSVRPSGNHSFIHQCPRHFPYVARTLC